MIPFWYVLYDNLGLSQNKRYINKMAEASAAQRLSSQSIAVNVWSSMSTRIRPSADPERDHQIAQAAGEELRKTYCETFEKFPDTWRQSFLDAGEMLRSLAVVDQQAHLMEEGANTQPLEPENNDVGGAEEEGVVAAQGDADAASSAPPEQPLSALIVYNPDSGVQLDTKSQPDGSIQPVLIGTRPGVDLALRSGSRLHTALYAVPELGKLLAVDLGCLSGIVTVDRSGPGPKTVSKMGSRATIILDRGETATLRLLQTNIRVCWIEEPKECIACNERLRATRFPCGHHLCCWPCSLRLERCPTCRSPDVAPGAPLPGPAVTYQHVK
jgi:hypothetical protein